MFNYIFSVRRTLQITLSLAMASQHCHCEKQDQLLHFQNCERTTTFDLSFTWMFLFHCNRFPKLSNSDRSNKALTSLIAISDLRLRPTIQDCSSRRHSMESICYLSVLRSKRSSGGWAFRNRSQSIVSDDRHQWRHCGDTGMGHCSGLCVLFLLSIRFDWLFRV